MGNTVIMDKNAIRRTVIRLSHEVLEGNFSLDDVVLVGIKRRGEMVAMRIQKYLAQQSGQEIPCAGIDIRTFRDDVNTAQLPTPSEILPFDVTGKVVILCDDVLHTGRSVRAAIEGLFTIGRPQGVRLLVLADRGGREVPVRADFVGKNIPAAKGEHIQFDMEELGAAEDRVYITKLG